MAMTETDRKRPAWVWVISIFMLISAVWTLFSFYLIGSGSVPVTPEQQTYFNSLTTVDYATAILGGLLNLGGAITLFLLRKVALPLFGSALALNVASTAYQAISKNWLDAIGTSGLIGSAIGLGILLAIVLYTRSLVRKGVLT